MASSNISVSLHSANDFDEALEEGAPDREPPVSCMGLPAPPKPPARTVVPIKDLSKASYGCSLTRSPAGAEPGDLAPFSYAEIQPGSLNLRSKTYIKSKVKEPALLPVYELVAADLYSTQHKHWHIARRLQLPPVPQTAAMPDGTALDDANIPPLLVLHVMMPLNPATFFPGTTDGPNCSFIYYFRLPQGFDPAKFHGQEALKLLQRLAVPHADPAANLPIRQQVKMIARLANPVEWFESGLLSRTELRLLESWNAKPVLMRPCQRFYRGKNYLEIDFDLHSFTYFARKSMEVYIYRLHPCRWDHAFCIEGRNESELPEVLLGGISCHYFDFTKVQPFPQSALRRSTKEGETGMREEGLEPGVLRAGIGVSGPEEGDGRLGSGDLRDELRDTADAQLPVRCKRVSQAQNRVSMTSQRSAASFASARSTFDGC